MVKDAGKPLIRMAELEIKPEHIDAYLAFLTEEIDASLEQEPGVITLNALSVKDQPHRVRIIEVYADQAAYEAHLQTPHFLKYKSGTLHMVQDLTLTEMDPIRFARG